MRSLSCILLISLAAANLCTAGFAGSKVNATPKHHATNAKRPPTKPSAKSPYTPKQKAALDTVLMKLANLDKATQAPLSKDDYKAEVTLAYHLLLGPLFDLSVKTAPVVHAKNAMQAYRDALTSWDEPLPYSEWDNIQESVYVTPGIVKKYNIPADFLESKKDLDVYDLEDYAHKVINTAIWKYAHDEYLKALAGKP